MAKPTEQEVRERVRKLYARGGTQRSTLPPFTEASFIGYVASYKGSMVNDGYLELTFRIPVEEKPNAMPLTDTYGKRLIVWCRPISVKEAVRAAPQA